MPDSPAPWRAIQFGLLDFITHQPALCPAFDAVLEGLDLKIGGFNLHVNRAAIIRLPNPAPPRVTEPAPSSTICVDDSHHFVGMIGTESILPVFDSESEGYESSGSRASIAEVFMAGSRASPLPDPNTSTGAGGGTGARQPTPEELERARRARLMDTPITDQTSPVDLEAYHRVMAEEREHLAEERRAADPAENRRAAESSAHYCDEHGRRRPRITESIVQAGRGARAGSVTTADVDGFRIYRTPMANILGATMLMEHLPADAKLRRAKPLQRCGYDESSNGATRGPPSRTSAKPLHSKHHGRILAAATKFQPATG